MRLEIDGISESDTGISTTYDSDPAKLHCCPLKATGQKKRILLKLWCLRPRLVCRNFQAEKENKLSDGPIGQFLVSDGAESLSIDSVDSLLDVFSRQ